MPGPQPRDHSRTARRNVRSTRAVLTEPDPDSVVIPNLPPLGKEWHPLAVQFWNEGWSSPLAEQWITVDIHGLYRLVDLIDRYWKAEKTTEKLTLSGEIRLLGQAYGTSPLDRRRLEWTVESSEKAKAEGERRRAGQQPVSPSAPKTNADNDPRLRLVE